MHDFKDQDHEQRLDDELAEFTDRLLSGEVKDERRESAQTPELRALEGTVTSLKQALVERPADPVIAERVQARLASEWKASGHVQPRQALHARRSWISRLASRIERSSTRPRLYAFRYAVVVILILVGVLILSPSLDASLTGMAGGMGGWIPLLLVGIVAIAAILVWFFTRHRS